MTTITNLMKRLTRREQGQGMVEYSLIVGLVSVAAIASMTSLGTQVKSVFTKATTAMSTVQ